MLTRLKDPEVDVLEILLIIAKDMTLVSMRVDIIKTVIGFIGSHSAEFFEELKEEKFVLKNQFDQIVK